MMRKSIFLSLVFAALFFFSGLSHAAEGGKDILVLYSDGSKPNFLWRYLRNNPEILDHVMKNMTLLVTAPEVKGKRSLAPVCVFNWLMDKGEKEKALEWMDGMENLPGSRNKLEMLTEMGFPPSEKGKLVELTKKYYSSVGKEQNRIADIMDALGLDNLKKEAAEVFERRQDIRIDEKSGQPFAVMPFGVVVANGKSDPEYFYRNFGFKQKR